MWIVFVVLILGGGACTAVGWYGFVGKLPPNWIAGIRTPYTMKSPENWYAVHRAGGPYVIFGGVACAAAGLAFLPFAIAGQVPDALAAGVAIGAAVVLGGSAIASWLVGTRAAKSRAA